MISQLLEESPPNGARLRAGELEHQAAVAPGDSKEAHSPQVPVHPKRLNA
jgi:hypothetical protein